MSKFFVRLTSATVFVTLLFLSANILPAHAAGLTSSQIDSIIGLLQSFGADQSVINSVKISLNGGVPVTGTNSCYNFATNLRLGMSGPSVTALQTALQNDGESVTVTNVFDEQTASAVTGFQQKYANAILTPNGLRYGTGYVGAATRVKLNSLCADGGQQTTPPVTSVVPVPPTPTQTPTVTITGPFTATVNNLVAIGGKSTLPSGTAVSVTVGTYNTSGQVQSDGSWLVTFNSGFSAGSYPITVAGFSVSGLTGTLATGTLIVTAPTNSSASGTLLFSNNSLNFSYTQGGATPATQSITFSNTSITDITDTISAPNSPWWMSIGYTTGILRASPSSPAAVSVTVNPAGLAAGTYTASVVISGNFTGSPVTIPVILTVVPSTTAPVPTFSANANTVLSGNTVTFSWSGAIPRNSSSVSNFGESPCPYGVTFFDVTNNQNFLCGDVARPVAASGSDTIRFTNTTTAQVQVTFQLDTATGSLPLTQSITILPVAPAPTATITSSIIGVVGAPITISGTSSLSPGTWVSVSIETSNGGGSVQSNGTWSVAFNSGFSAGSYPITVSATGLANALTTSTLTIVAVDPSNLTPAAPQITSATTLNVSQSDALNHTISWQAVSGTGTYSYKIQIDGVSPQNIGNTTSWGFNVKAGLPTSLSTVGSHTFNVQACNTNTYACSGWSNTVTVNVTQ